ncbi:hypothetical protein RM190_05125 [Paracoccus sp. CPCC 101403]|uniref:Secreted protein n=3 Tax=Paracoccus broussonetiae TaxID=3075834 RepID=A0ABU3EAI6_9RHOB|nr:hypothetical protein [Paracoccus sp. CPCC 101403]
MMTAKRNCLALAALLALAGCDDRIGDYPSLLPTDQLLAEPALPSHAADVAQSPQATSDALTGRAKGLANRTPAPAVGAAELSARADALRERAAQLSKTSLDACPDGAATCESPAPAGGDDPAGKTPASE